jgi:hypothetical protein
MSALEYLGFTDIESQQAPNLYPSKTATLPMSSHRDARSPRLHRRTALPGPAGLPGAAPVARAAPAEDAGPCAHPCAHGGEDAGLCCRGLPALRPEGGRIEPEPGHQRGEAAELRCGCGSLLARLVQDHLELKCRRCKRAWMIPVTAG